MPFDIDPTQLLIRAEAILMREILSIDTGWQCAIILSLSLVGYIIARPIKRLVTRLREQVHNRWLDPWFNALQSIAAPAIVWLLFYSYPPIVESLKTHDGLLRVAHNLLGAWIVIRFASSFIEYKRLARTLAIIVWVLAALNSVGWLEPIITQLDNIALTLGETKISILMVLKGMVAFVVVLWGANMLSRLSERYILRVDHLTPSLQVLISKMVRVALIVFAITIGLNTLGIDLTSLAVFSGAVGVGLGFGLQKVVSNFISGIILLLDRSIKPGDVIAIEDTYGWVNKLSARHVSVITRDGKEHLIPNELLITERVENWSYSDRNIRLKIPVGISYDNDPREALKLMAEAAAECPRILKNPKPNPLVIGFGDSCVDLELRCWIDDPGNGIRNITSEIYLAIWDKFKQAGIVIPYPQRDVHIKSGNA